jgi:hypothetical protein
MAATKPMAVRLPAGGGRREDRYFHTLGTETLDELQTSEPASHTVSQHSSAPRQDTYAQLEARVADLEQRLASLESQLL